MCRSLSSIPAGFRQPRTERNDGRRTRAGRRQGSRLVKASDLIPSMRGSESSSCQSFLIGPFTSPERAFWCLRGHPRRAVPSRELMRSERAFNTVLFTGNANPALAQERSRDTRHRARQGIGRRFSDGEVDVEIQQNVRARDLFVVQPTCAPTNENLMEL